MDQPAQERPGERVISHKESLGTSLHTGDSAVEKYRQFFVGRPGWSALLRYELAVTLAGPLPGALGYLLRKRLYGGLLRRTGRSVHWGRNVALRHPGRIEVGERVAIDDDCLLDARGAGEEGIRIGDDVLIARATILQAKTSWISVGNHCIVGSQCQFASAVGIRLGNWVMLGGQCYVGGGRYRTEDRDRPIMRQEVYSKGEVVIEDDVWLGAGVIVQDGVRIGRGSVVGAGAVVREDLPEFSVATPHQRLVLLPRPGGETRTGGP